MKKRKKHPLPCPFCGEEDFQYPNVDIINFIVLCLNCYAQGPPRNTTKRAIESWNERV